MTFVGSLSADAHPTMIYPGFRREFLLSEAPKNAVVNPTPQKWKRLLVRASPKQSYDCFIFLLLI
jgi:hypothetical protein